MTDIEQGALVLAKNIRRLCEEKGMTHRALAEKAGITKVSISRYCSGKRVPSAPTLYAMAKALDCRMDDLMEGVDVDVPEEADEDIEEV